MSGSNEHRALLRLLTWMSPAFPVGAFAYSGGLERAVADGLVSDKPGSERWIAQVIERGAGWNDAVLLAEAHAAFDDTDKLSMLAELAEALSGSRERYLETMALGTAFLEAASAWPDPVSERLPKRVAYPVAVGAVAGAHDVGLEPVLVGYLHAMASQMVSAGIRLSVIGQRDGVAVLAGLEARIEMIAGHAVAAGLDGLGSATVMAEISSLRHETQHTRLFRS